MASNDMREFAIEPATERRATPRVPFPTSCVLLLHGQPHPASCVDISEAGLGCMINPALGSAPILLGITIKVHLTLDSGALELTAVIVRSALHSNGDVVLGLHFRNVSKPAADQIRTAVSAHLEALRAAGQL